MKVRSFRTPRPLLAAVAQGRTILRGCVVIFRRTIAVAPVIALGTILLAWLLWPYDQALLDALHATSLYDHAAAHNLAWYLGSFGDYPTYNLPFAILLWLTGIATKNTTCRRLAVIAFLGATLAGLFDDCFRLTLGRPRPDMLALHGDLANRLYGPLYALHYGGYQSFPSGHAASTVGMAVALLLTEWRLGILTTLIAAGVLWGRMELNKHFPSDVLVGAIIGLYFGLLVGYGRGGGELNLLNMDDANLAHGSAEYTMEFAKLAQRLAMIPIWIDRLNINYGAFGHWELVVRRGNKALRFFFDGRDKYVEVEESQVRELSAPNQWKQLNASSAKDWREAIEYTEKFLRDRFTST